jgi:competence protein ComEC
MFFVGIVLSTLVASAAVAPFAAYHFHQSQQYAVLANLVEIPICNLVVMPAALATLLLMPLGLEALPLWIMGLGIECMTWVAERVGSLPGAVGRIPAMPTLALLLMVAGGLWLALWQTRWRLLGGAGLIAAGIGLAPTLQRPDVLIARDGALVAARSDDRQLSAVGSRRPSFELIRWLEHDGDTRAPEEATKAQGFRCDAVGCRTSVKGVTVAVARHPAALNDDCQRAKILISSFANPRGCDGPAVLIDFFAARRGGTHAVYIEEDGHIRVETVAQRRGVRPWSSRPTKRFGKKRGPKLQ